MLIGHKKSVIRVLFANGGSQIVSCSDDKTIRVFNVSDAKCDSVLRAHTSYVFGIALSQGERFLFSCSRDKQIISWINRSIVKKMIYGINLSRILIPLQRILGKQFVGLFLFPFVLGPVQHFSQFELMILANDIGCDMDIMEVAANFTNVDEYEKYINEVIDSKKTL